MSDAARRHVERFNDAVRTGRWAEFTAESIEELVAGLEIAFG